MAASGTAVERLVDEVAGWPGVETAAHRFGGTEFRVGSREFGHVHAFGLLDVPYRRALRDALVAEGRTGPHHLLADSGWTSFRIASADDYEHARWLLRLSYLAHVDALVRRPAGAEAFADVDVEVDVAALDPSEAVLAAFERRTG